MEQEEGRAAGAPGPGCGGGAAAAGAAATAADAAPLPRHPSEHWDEAGHQVVLNIEYFSDRTSRALLLQFRVALVSATALLVWESVEKYTTPSDDFMRGDALPIANSTLAGVCLVVLLGLGGLLLWRVWRVHRAGRAWSPRRKTTVALFGLELAVQALNLTFYLAPNAYVLAQPCSWFLLPVHVFALVRWTCQNTMFCIFVLQAHNPLPAQYRGPVLLHAAVAGAMDPVRAAGKFVQRAASFTGHQVERVAGEVGRGADAAFHRVAAAAATVPAWRAAGRAHSGGVGGAARGASARAQPRGGPAPAAPAAPAAPEEDKAGEEEEEEDAAEAALAAAAQAGAAGRREEEGEKSAAQSALEAAAEEEELMIADLGWRSHWGKVLLLWVPAQVAIICYCLFAFGVFSDDRGPCASLDDLRCFPQAADGTADCRNWAYDCQSSTARIVLTSLISGLALATLAAYFWMVWVAWRELRRRPYAPFRANNISLRLQAQTRLWTAFFLAASYILLWYIDSYSCTSYVLTMMGLGSGQVVLTSLAVLNVWSILPCDPSQSLLELHVYLQDFAWTEADLPRKLARRPVRASEPMFVFESAVKLLCWSWMVYFDEGEPPAPEGEPPQLPDDAPQQLPATAEEEPQQLQGSSSGGVALEGVEQQPQPQQQPPPQQQQQQGQPMLGGNGPATKASSGISAAGSLDPRDGKGAVAAGIALDKVSAALSTASCASDGTGMSLQTALGLFGLEHFQELWGPELDAKCVVAWDAQAERGGGGGTIVLAFRGTTSLVNMRNNMQFWRTPHPPRRGSYWLGRQPLVHHGYFDTWQASTLSTQVNGVLRRLLGARPPAPPPPGTPPPPPWRLLLTGHSLGGALASFAAHEAVQLCRGLGLDPRGGALQLSVYTFGAPPPGNAAFARDYRATVPASWDVIHTDDTVVRNGSFMRLYTRASHAVVLTSNGDLLVRPSHIEKAVRERLGTSINQHFLSAYGRSLARIMRGQFVPAKEFNGGRRGCQALLDCEYVRVVLRETAGVRQESLVRLRTGSPAPGAAGPGDAEELQAREEREAAQLHGVGGRDDRHLAAGGKLTPKQRAAAQLAARGHSVRLPGERLLSLIALQPHVRSRDASPAGRRRPPAPHRLQRVSAPPSTSAGATVDAV